MHLLYTPWRDTATVSSSNHPVAMMICDTQSWCHNIWDSTTWLSTVWRCAISMTTISSLVHLFTANDSFTVESQNITSNKKMWTRQLSPFRPTYANLPSYGTVLYRGYCNGAKHIRQEAHVRQVFSFHARSCRSWSTGDKPEWIPVLTPLFAAADVM